MHGRSGRSPGRSAGALVVILLAAGILQGAAGRAVRASTDTGTLAFTTTRDGNSEIYLTDLADGTTVNFTSNPANDESPVWAPFGRWLAFVSDRGGQPSLYVAGRDGYAAKIADALTNGWAWAPDGRSIAWKSPADGDLWVTDVPDLTATNLTKGLVTVAGDPWTPFAPPAIAWSPDGDRVAFQAGDGAGGTDVFVVGIGGGAARNITAGRPGDSARPKWSPDGSRIAFVSQSATAQRLYVAHPDGGGVTAVSPEQNCGFVDTYSWSPDGTTIAYGFSTTRFGIDVCNGTGSIDFFTVRLSGGSPVKVATGGAPRSEEPVWSPTGRQLALVTGSASSEVKRVDVDGGNPFTYPGGRSPEWSPDGSLLAFVVPPSPAFPAFVAPTITVAGAPRSSPRQVFPADQPAWLPDPPWLVGLVDTATGLWHLHGERAFYFGTPGDLPMMGDWDCDGFDSPGLYRPRDGYVYLSNVNATAAASIRFHLGVAGDIPLAGDWDGDGCDTVSVYRPSEGRVFIADRLGAGEGWFAADYSYFFGDPGDKPFAGDFDGDGIDTVGLHRESSGFVYFLNHHRTAVADSSFYFGDPGDRLVAGDWTWQGLDTVAVYRPGETRFYFRYSNTQGTADALLVFGRSDWLPVDGFFSLD